MKKVAIIDGSRSPFVKSLNQYQGVTNQELLSVAFNHLIAKTKIEGKLLGDVIMGTVMNHPFDWNLSREVVLGSKLDHSTPGMNLQRACGTGLEAANLIALKIKTGQIDSGIAGGSDTNSDIPLVGQRKLTQFLMKLQSAKTIPQKLMALSKFNPMLLKPELPAVKEPRTGKSMGEHCELMVKEWKISRADQDQLAQLSHQNAARAYEEGFLEDQIAHFKGLKKDTITRGDTTIEKLARLKPAFDRSENGSLTAGNSTPLTDGASAVLMCSEEWANQNNLDVAAYFVDAEVAALDFVHGAGLLMAPTLAVARLLERNKLKLQDFDFYEIHEAFAGQVLCTLKAWESDDFCKNVLSQKHALGAIDRSKMNVKGSSLAFGHPFAATGGRILSTAAKLLKQKGHGRALISICTAGGMGVAAIIER
jgi:acetyl-CoA C-acetyltransferase